MTAALQAQLSSPDLATVTTAAEALAQQAENVDPEFIVTVYDNYWQPIAEIAGGDLLEHSGTQPRNNVPSATLKLQGSSDLIEVFQNCRTTLVGVTFETGGLRFAYYCDTFDYDCDEKGEWVGTANLLGIWDILNYLQVWPDWMLPIQAQVLSYAIYFWAIVTCIENMIAAQAFRLQSGLNEFINTAGSLDPDIQAWFGTALMDHGNIIANLKTPIYVARHNPLADTSMIICRTVRMESCGAVIKDITRAYGVDVSVDLWLEGDPQPDEWANLNKPTYVITVKDRTNVTTPFKGILGSVLRTTVDLVGSLGDAINPLLNPQGEYAPDWINIAPSLGVNFVEPWAILVAPEPGQKGSVFTCKISDHTPKGWQHIIGGRSPQWLNQFFNTCFSWLIDSLTIILGVGGVPSDLLSGFLNNSFLSFQLVLQQQRREQVGPYHPAIEVFHSTATAPYSIETEFDFLNALWDSRGWTCAQVTFRNGVYKLGTDIFPGQLMSVVYMGRTKMLTDYIENILWKVDTKTRDLLIQVGDGKAKESPLAKHQRNITGILESINILTLAPQSS